MFEHAKLQHLTQLADKLSLEQPEKVAHLHTRSSSGTKPFVPDEDLRGRNIVLLQSLFATWMRKILDDYISETVAMSLNDVIIK